MPVTGWTLLYDGECALCRRGVAALRAWDRDRVVECVPYQEPEARARVPHLSEAALRQAMHLVAPDGRSWPGAAAIERLLTLLPRGRALAWAMRLPGLDALADLVYRWVARHRLRFGCGAHCGTRDGRDLPRG